jgi:hypothetical protein
LRLRVVRWSVAAGLVLVTAAAGAAEAGHVAVPPPCGGNTAYAGSGWLAIKTPLSTIAEAHALTFAPERIYATDGKATVVRSDDGGCSWADLSPTAPDLAGLGAADEAVTIAGLATPSSSTTSAYLYIGANVTPTDRLPVALPSQPYVYVSNTGGPPYSIANSSNGLPPVGTISQIAASDLSPRTVYVLIGGAGNSDGIWASGDAGASWTGPLAADTTLTQLRVDPTVSNRLYAVKPGVGVVRSVDGGRSFTALSRTSSDVRSFSAMPGSGSVQIAQGYASAGLVDLTRDGGRTWHTLSVGATKARSVAVSPITPILVAYDADHLVVARTVSGGSWTAQPQTPGLGAPREDSVGVSAPTAVGAAITGIARDNQHLLRLIYSTITFEVVGPSLTPIHLLTHTTVKQFPSVLTGATTTVALPAGGSRDVDYNLLLPRTPSPVDLMFLVDTTDSTDQMIDGVRQGIQTVVNELGSTGLSTQFGVADFRDYSYDVFGGGDDGDYPYKLRRRIGPANLSLQTALAALHSGDGGDVPESDLAALYYSTTGAGERFGKHWLISPGSGAGYRPSSLRLAVLATDEPFHRESDYPGPHWAKTVAALEAAGVHQIGLAVESTDPKGNPKPGAFDSLPDQRAMAIATGAIAPSGGVDCDGDGVTDIEVGSPLVCSISKPADTRIKAPTPTGAPKVVIGSPPPPVHLAPLIVQLAESIPDYRSVSLRVTGAPRGSARTVSPSTAPTVNIRADNTLGFVVRYTCPKSPKPHTWPLTVAARAGARSLTTTSAKLVCAPTSPLVAAPAVALTITTGLAPGAPPNPPTNVNANFNPNPAVNPNAGFAQQDEEQPQLALAESDQGLEEAAEGQQLAMSRRTSDTNAAWMLGAAGVMTAAAAGYATRRRWQGASQRW